ncbi:MAG TPA: type II toxin-antitoxin system RelE/ParE family toxin, partial [Cellvibrionaceae bacterium]|nr:type II toxin-antitoxin system RelE/ParE family toxin [Cellvibrionaceae bacterium]
MQIEWSNSALNDLEDIHHYIHKDSPFYANQFIEKVFDRVDRLAEFPKSGRKIPEYDHPDWREVMVGDYRIMYFLDNKSLLILAVMHGSRDLNNPHNQP